MSDDVTKFRNKKYLVKDEVDTLEREIEKLEISL